MISRASREAWEARDPERQDVHRIARVLEQQFGLEDAATRAAAIAKMERVVAAPCAGLWGRIADLLETRCATVAGAAPQRAP